MSTVTKARADAAAKAIGKVFGAEDGYGPKVLDRADYGDGRDGWIVSWEEGPFEWPYLMHGGLNEEMFSMLHPEFEPDAEKARKRCTIDAVKMPKGVVGEAINHYSVGLYDESKY